MMKLEIQKSGEDWNVVDGETGMPLRNSPPAIRSRLEAQAFADLRTGLSKPAGQRVVSRLEAIRIAWKTVTGSGIR